MCSGPSFHAALGRLVLGKPPLHKFSRHVVGSLWTLSLVDCPPPSTFTGFGLFVGGKVFFLDGQLPVEQGMVGSCSLVSDLDRGFSPTVRYLVK